MRLLQQTFAADAVLIADEVFALDFPPVTSGIVPTSWNSRGLDGGVVPELDFEFWANATLTLTDAELFAASPHPLVVADQHPTPSRSSLDLGTKTTHCTTVVEAVAVGDQTAVTLAFVADGVGQGTLNESAYPAIVFHYQTTVTTNANFEAKVAAGTRLRVKTPAGAPATALVAVVDAFAAANLVGGIDNALHLTAHGHLTGDGPFREAAATTLPAGLSVDVDYWVTKLGADDYTLATSLADALAGTAVAITDGGTGAITESDTPQTGRLAWHSHGLLGPTGDGTIELAIDRGYWCTRPHRSRVAAYAVVGTLSASDPEAVSVSMLPVEDRG